MVEINLLPWRVQLKHKRQNKQKGEMILALVFAFLLLLGLHFILLGQIQAVNTRLFQTQGGLARVNKSLEELRLLYQELDYQKLPDFDINTILNRQRQILGFLRKLPELMPREVYARQILFDEQAWTIDGVSLVLTDILLFSERLKNNLKGGAWDEALKKEKFLSIKQRNGLFSYQFRFESGL